LKTINDLPLWTEIHIQPLNTDDMKNGEVFWIKHPRLKTSVYDKDLDVAIQDFIELYERQGE